MKQAYYYFPNLESPTKYNLAHAMQAAGVCATHDKNEAQFSEQNLSLDELAVRHLEYKHLLAKQVNQYCPEVAPLTFPINDQNHPEVINLLAKQYYRQQDEVEDLVWILKPSMQNNGENIKIFYRFSQLIKHYASANRLGGDHVLQQYIVRPHLLNGYKYSFRMYVIITNYNGAYLYCNGYFNIGMQPYSTEDHFTDLSLHVTNEHLFKDKENVMQVPTSRCPNFELIYQQMHSICSKVLAAQQQTAPVLLLQTAQRAFEIFGFDFILDAQQRLWLLEVNQAPCFPKEEPHHLKSHLYEQLFRDVTVSFVLPIMQNVSDGPDKNLFNIIT